MPAGRTIFTAHGRRGKRAKRAVPVVVVKQKRKRRGPRVSQPLKKKTVVKLRYVDTISIDPGVAAIASHDFLANGLFDPDNTGTGHQPLGFDQMTLMYNQYRVLSSKIKVTQITTASSNVIPGLWGIVTDNDGTLTFTEGTAVIEDPRQGKTWAIANGHETAFNGSNARILRKSFNKTMLNPEQRNDATLVSADPDAATRFHYLIWLSSILGNNPGAISFMVELDYVCEFSDPVHLAQS